MIAIFDILILISELNRKTNFEEEYFTESGT